MMVPYFFVLLLTAIYITTWYVVNRSAESVAQQELQKLVARRTSYEEACWAIYQHNWHKWWIWLIVIASTSTPVTVTLGPNSGCLNLLVLAILYVGVNYHWSVRLNHWEFVYYNRWYGCPQCSDGRLDPLPETSELQPHFPIGTLTCSKRGSYHRIDEGTNLILWDETGIPFSLCQNHGDSFDRTRWLARGSFAQYLHVFNHPLKVWKLCPFFGGWWLIVRTQLVNGYKADFNLRIVKTKHLPSEYQT